MSRNDSIPPFYKLHLAKIATDITGLPAVQAGLYEELRLLYWNNACSLPDKLERRVTVKGYSEADLSAVLEEFFPGGRHAWLDEQRGAIDGTRNQARQAAHARWSRSKHPETANEPPKVEPPDEDASDF